MQGPRNNAQPAHSAVIIVASITIVRNTIPARKAASIHQTSSPAALMMNNAAAVVVMAIHVLIHQTADALKITLRTHGS